MAAEKGDPMEFTLVSPAGDPAALAVVIRREFVLRAPVQRVFSVLADHERWPTWFTGMRRARVDGPASGVGARRTVWAGAARVSEQFDLWEPDALLRFSITSSSIPGLRRMAEDWALEPLDAELTRLVVTIGAEPVGPPRLMNPVARVAVSRSTRGVAGISRAVRP